MTLSRDGIPSGFGKMSISKAINVATAMNAKKSAPSRSVIRCRRS
jgi:hypothetical protein